MIELWDEIQERGKCRGCHEYIKFRYINRNGFCLWCDEASRAIEYRRNLETDEVDWAISSKYVREP